MKIFEVAGVGKLHGLTVMSLDSFVDKEEDDVEESQIDEIDRRGFLKGLAEGSLEELANTSLKVKEPKDFVNTNDRKQVTYKVMKFKSGKDTYLINFTVKGAPAFGKKQNWNAVNVSFGVREEQDDYSFGDEINTDLTAKNKNQFLIYSTVINAVRKFITEYNTEIDEIIMQGAGERQEAMYQRFFQSAGKYFPGWHHDGKHSLVRDVPRPTGKKVREQGMAEADMTRRGFLQGAGAAAVAGGAGFKMGQNGASDNGNPYTVDKLSSEDLKAIDTNLTWYAIVRRNGKPSSLPGVGRNYDAEWEARTVKDLIKVYGKDFIFSRLKKIQDRVVAMSDQELEREFNRFWTGPPDTSKSAYIYNKLLPDHKLNKESVNQGMAEAPGDFGLGANYRAVPDAEMQDLLGRSKNKTKTKRDKFDYPYIHGSNIEVKDEGGKTFDTEKLKAAIMTRPASILGQNAKMQHSETGEEAIFDIGLPALKGLAVNEKTGEFVVVDTCPGAGACKTFCYAMKGSYVMFKAVSMGLARMLNFLLNDPEGFANKLNAEIAAAKSKMAKKNAKVVVRWHDAGDFFSAEYLAMAYSVANANPDVGFYAYTKMADVATGQRPKNFNMNFSGGALSSQEKKVDFQRVKHSKVVPKDMFFDLIARDGNSLKKDAKGRMQFASPENLDQFKSIMSQKYAVAKDSILTYDEMMKTPVGDKPKWNVIVMPGDGDNSANRNDVVGSYLLFH